MTSRQRTGRGQEPTSKIATPKVPIHPFMNVRPRVRDVCCGSGIVVATASAPRLLMAQMRSADRAQKCLLFWVDRTYRRQLLNNANDP
jgi:hypothetical protein